MISKFSFHSVLFSGFTCLALGDAGAQVPDTLKLTAKLRDFLEYNTKGVGPTHPDFNTFPSCPDRGYVDSLIHTDGLMDSAVFPYDNRTPKLLRTVSSYGRTCYTGTAIFEDWYNDRDTNTNRPYLTDLNFVRQPNGMYEYDNSLFFPLDPGSPYRNLPGKNLRTFGVLQANSHNYGFTMEFHSDFTYLPKTGQVFTFRGDDDVWVFMNGKLVIDLGGLHTPESGTVILDSAAARLGLQDHESYTLDLFFAERHFSGSNCKITTSLLLGRQKVATPVATPGSSAFLSQIAVSLATATPDAAIHYTLDGSKPGFASPVWDPTRPLQVTSTTTIKAVAYRQFWTTSDIMTETYTKTKVASTVEILDKNGNPLAGGFLSDADDAYRIKVTTTQAGLTQVSPTADTRAAADVETLTLDSPAFANDRYTFLRAAPIAFTANAVALIGNGKTEASHYDSLTIRWVNPLDASDSAVKTVAVRPALKQARAYFSRRADGADTTDQFLGTETRIYLVVVDEALPAGMVPSITLETTPKIGQARAKDTETLTLSGTSAKPGISIFPIDVDINPVSVPGDKRLQLAMDDLIRATYTDPMDKEEPAVANAGYGIAPEVDASVQFTDKDGNALPGGVNYDPAKGSLYLTYSDDWVNGSITKKSVILSVENNGGQSPADAETLTVAFQPAKRKGSVGLWQGSINLAARPEISAGNKIVETYIIGKVKASVLSHDKSGAPQSAVTDELTVANPNGEADLSIEGPQGPGVKINREDAFVRITLKDQDLSAGKDSLYVTLSCMESRDALQHLLLIEKSGAPGTYVSAAIGKSEGAGKDDAVLQCLSKDEIKVSYTDPVYKDGKEIRALIDNAVTTRIYFTATASDSTPIASVDDRDRGEFYAVVSAQSPTVDKIDTVRIKFTTTQGEQETFLGVETGVYTGVFKAKVTFAFVNGGKTENNGTLEAKLDPGDADNRIVATGAVTVDGVNARADMLMVSGFNPVIRAYIKDTDGNGSGDNVYVVFERKLPGLPDHLGAQWNMGGTGFATVSGAALSFLADDSSVVVADYSAQPFGAGLTSIPAGESPRAKLPDNALFGNQSPIIEDSIGPILISAVKRPANLNAMLPNDPRYFHDTLIVTLSEPIKAASDFKQMLKFAVSCDDYAHAITINALSNPSADFNNPNRYTVIVDNSQGGSPQVSNCVFLNADADKYTDLQGNQAPKYGVELTGGNSEKIIKVMRGFPPVAGLDPNHPEFQVAVQDSRDPDKSAYSTLSGSDWQLLWIPPVGWEAGKPFTPYQVSDFSSVPGSTAEVARGIPMPADISTIQVVSSAAYIAYVTIYDTQGNFVNSSVQAFGAKGELKNISRVVPKGLVSYLYWNQRDRSGQLAAQGAYVWKVVFKFQGGKNEVQYTRTGLIRHG